MRALLLVALLFLAGCTDAPAPVAGERMAPVALPLHGLLLRGGEDVVVEIDHMEGRAPSAWTLSQIERALRDVAGKRVVRMGEPQPIPGLAGDARREWHPAEIEGIAGGVENARPDAGAYVHLVFLDGRGRDERGPFRGVQIGDTLAVFPDTLKPSVMLGQGDGPRFPHHERLEAQVTLHELGHAFGLVDCGLPMQEPRADPESRCHSTRQASVMRAYVDLIDMTRDYALEGSAVPSWYDEADLADVAAFQRG